MSSIQGGAIRWIDSTAGSPALPANRAPPANIPVNPLVLDPAVNTDSLMIVTSAIEEEGMIAQPLEATSPRETVHDSLEEELSEGEDELFASDELAAAIAKHLEIVEAAMRQHPGGETSRFHKDNGADHRDADNSGYNDDQTSEPFDSSLIGDMLQDPGTAFAATIPKQNRLALLGMLG